MPIRRATCQTHIVCARALHREGNRCGFCCSFFHVKAAVNGHCAERLTTQCFAHTWFSFPAHAAVFDFLEQIMVAHKQVCSSSTPLPSRRSHAHPKNNATTKLASVMHLQQQIGASLSAEQGDKSKCTSVSSWCNSTRRTIAHQVAL